jgi:hypothetical protein
MDKKRIKTVITNYICDKCNTKFKDKKIYVSHLARKFPCVPDKSMIENDIKKHKDKLLLGNKLENGKYEIDEMRFITIIGNDCYIKKMEINPL